MATPSLLLITDRNNTTLPFDAVILEALEAGCRWIMVREKKMATAELCPLLDSIVALSADFGAAVTVNSNYTAASLCKIPGVHLPQMAPVATVRRVVGAQMLIGASTHSLAEAQTAIAEGANYVTMSPIFLTDSKPGYGPALGLENLRVMTQAIGAPVLALGGVTVDNAADCVRAGAAGVAVMGSVMRSPTPGAIIRDLIETLSTVAT
jgi:thiamine-phosphate pyrophosphorylase